MQTSVIKRLARCSRTLTQSTWIQSPCLRRMERVRGGPQPTGSEQEDCVRVRHHRLRSQSQRCTCQPRQVHQDQIDVSAEFLTLAQQQGARKAARKPVNVQSLRAKTLKRCSRLASTQSPANDSHLSNAPDSMLVDAKGRPVPQNMQAFSSHHRTNGKRLIQRDRHWRSPLISCCCSEKSEPGWPATWQFKRRTR